MIRRHEIGEIRVAHSCRFATGSLSRIYEIALDAFKLSDLTPTYCATSSSEPIERDGIEQADHFTIARLADGREYPDYEWEVLWCLSKPMKYVAEGILLHSHGAGKSSEGRCFQQAAREGLPTYGYMFRQRLELSPRLYISGSLGGKSSGSRSQEIKYNISWWGLNGPQGSPQSHPILRDVYPENFLSNPYLVAPIGRTTTNLRDWILADTASRGTLEPFTDALTKWTPPVTRIPEIREELYRAGRVFYWRFFCPGHGGLYTNEISPEPLFRSDLSAPWEAPDPIPEIFCADYWRDRDPGLTY